MTKQKNKGESKSNVNIKFIPKREGIHAVYYAHGIPLKFHVVATAV